ncbi:MAG: DUF2917 domain-containing protein [Verrucomicrobiaceae bacterium]|jgi:hypothetical protein|nr:MAG: DUF2917 domain-containing protein [Verrucomicrobiaceae bacterium]
MISCPTIMEISDRDPRVSRRAAQTDLAARETFARRLEEGEFLRMRVVSGMLWVTLEGDPEDHVLAAGDFRQFDGPGLCVMESIDGGAQFEMG